MRRGLWTQGEGDALHEYGGVDHIALEPLEEQPRTRLPVRAGSDGLLHLREARVRGGEVGGGSGVRGLERVCEGCVKGVWRVCKV